MPVPYEQMLGEHSAEIRNLRGDIHEIKGELEKINATLSNMSSFSAEQKGGLKVLLWLATASATAGGLVGTVIGHFYGKTP